MQPEDFLSDEFLKQFKTGEQLNSFLAQIQKTDLAALETFEQTSNGKYAYSF